jgi:Ca2+-binding EF-hand superfamily protein
MSSISATSSSSDVWAAQRTQMQAKMFAEVDSNGDGSVDKSELSTMLGQISEKTGLSLDSSTSDTFSKMDSNSDGSLSSDELSQGMEKLMPPRSTMDFAQAHQTSSSSSTNSNPMDAFFSSIDSNGDGSLDSNELTALADKVKAETGSDVSSQLHQLASDNGGTVSKDAFMQAMRPSGPPPGGPGGAGGPPPSAGTQTSSATSATSSSSSSSSSTTYDPLDTNQDGTVSEMERLVGQLQAASQTSTSDSDKTQSGGFDLARFASHMYEQMAHNWSQQGSSTSSSLNAVA